MSRLPLFLLGLFSLLLLLIRPAVADSPQQGQGSSPPPIELLTRTFTPPAGLGPALQNMLTAQAGERRHVLLQLNYIPTLQQRADLAAQGIELQTYVPQQAWIARVPTVGLAHLAEVNGIRWIGPWSAPDKIAPRLQAGQPSAWTVHPSGRVMVMVLLHADVSLDQGEALVKQYDGVVAGRLTLPRALTAWLMPDRIAGLAAEESVLWLGEGPPPLTPNNDGVRQAIHADEVQAAGLTGSGVKLFVFDVGRVANHIGFTGRLTYTDNTTNVEEHSTHVAGTAAGSGKGSPDGRDLRGVAPAALIYSAGYSQTGGTAYFWDNAGDIEADYATARQTYGVDLATTSLGSNIASNSYSCDLEGDYGVTASLIDGIIRGDNSTVGSPYIVLWSNGNERLDSYTWQTGRCGPNFHTTPPPSCAKNPTHVGATNADYNSMTDFSSWGPCDDGRLKPIVSGPGCKSGLIDESEYGIYSTILDNQYDYNCGTSMSTPAVAGVATLAIQQYRMVTGNPTLRPTNALMKAWLIHTAHDQGPDGPDYMYGYGQVDAQAVINLVKSPASYRLDSVGQNITNTISYTIPANTRQFKASLAWDDPAAAAFAASSLVNDLDLEVVAPDGTTLYYPYSLNPYQPSQPATATGPNTKDNQEQVVITDPAEGIWTVRVKGTGIPEGPQEYALVTSHTVDTTTVCTELIQNGNFEAGTGSWQLSGASRVTSPGIPPAGGVSALKLGGVRSATQTAFQVVTIPLTITTATLSFDWYMTTDTGYPYYLDYLYAELRDQSDRLLAVYDIQSNAALTNTWKVSDNVDLTTYRGSLRLSFRAVNDADFPATTFYVDNISLKACGDPNAPIYERYLPLILKNQR
jgi:hypothetical protein